MDTVTSGRRAPPHHGPNGLVVLTEQLPGVRSAATGFYVRTASAHERREQMGISHLLEHMVFKGTERRTAKELALELEVRGGSLDAFTGRDYTSYQAHMLDADLPLAVEILTDLSRRPLLRESDLEPERNVILEEINGVEDTPDDLVFELHAAELWPQHPYGYSILGTPARWPRSRPTTYGACTRRATIRGNFVVAAAGNVNHDQLLTVLEREGWFEGTVPEPARRPVDADPGRPGHRASRGARHRADPHRLRYRHLSAARPAALRPRHPHQRVRRRACPAACSSGSARSWGSPTPSSPTSTSTSRPGSSACTSAPSRPRRTPPSRPSAESTRGSRSEGLPADELADGKRQLKGQVMLSLESPGARMGRLAGFVLHGDEYRPLDQMLAEIDAVDAEDVAAVAAEFFAPERQTVVRLGPGR